MPETDRQRHDKNARWSIDTLVNEPSLVSIERLYLYGFLPELKSGSLAPATVKELLTKEFSEQLLPDLFSGAGEKWLTDNKGSGELCSIASGTVPPERGTLAGY